MIDFGGFAFANPWMLAALPLVPILWWLLRITPPAPEIVRFPAIRLLFGLEGAEKTPATSPLWLVILRLMMATLLILGLARPLLNPDARLAGSGPLLLVVDDGWASARDWPVRQAAMREAIDQAGRNDRRVILLTTAPTAAGKAPAATDLLLPSQAQGLADAIQPKPWPYDREAAIAALEAIAVESSMPVLWLSNGLHDASVTRLAARLQRFGTLRVKADPVGRLPRLLLPPETRGMKLTVNMRRAATPIAAHSRLRGRAADGRVLVQETASFAPGEATAAVTLELPIELRNELTRLELVDEATAGAVVLLDERWQRRPVGLISDQPLGSGPVLLSDIYYIERALNPFSEVRRGAVAALVGAGRSVIIVPDSQPLQPDDWRKLDAWIKRGGLVLRFAGPRLARGDRGDKDPLTPVPLRVGGRALGGALLWTEPARLAPFDENSPFLGLKIPSDVTIAQQVLAEPSLDLAERTWARLTDGTPLVTAERRGDGWLVLVHTTASTAWSNLPLSGLFVEMLRRVVTLSQRVAEQGSQSRPLPPLELLDGFGRAIKPPPTVGTIDASAFAAARAAPGTPPGYYGTEDSRRALNLSPQAATLAPIRELPAGVELADYARSEEIDLKPWILALTLLLLVADSAATLVLRGLLPMPWRRLSRAATGAVLAAVLLFPAANETRAQSAKSPEAFALEATLKTRLAYVLTGQPDSDEISRSGLTGLSMVVSQRTAAELGTPIGVDIARDELAFFPLLYWPVDPSQPAPTPPAIRRLNRYLADGGTILFDTRDRTVGGGLFGAGAQALQRLARGLDLPPLSPVPPDHVLTKSFYLMQDFPGRWTGGQVWVERPGERVNDGVSSIIVGSHDWAAAWSMDLAGRPVFPVVPGGEKQREAAFRFGINLIMYALTGNYKADQVHIPAILERLGQ